MFLVDEKNNGHMFIYWEKISTDLYLLLLATVGLKFSSSNLSPILTSILGAQFNSPLNDFILLRKKLEYKEIVISNEGKTIAD